MDCPQSRVGEVIGKNGSMMKQIMEKCKVAINVDKTTNQIEITGTTSSIELAEKELSAIIRATEIEFTPNNDKLINYLTSKHVNVITQLKTEYPAAYMVVIKSSSKIVLRGSPEDVNELKSRIENLPLVSQDRPLEGKEFSILLGKKGATIDALVKKYSLAIEVTKIDQDHADCSIMGPPTDVDAAVQEIESLLKENKEMTETISVELITKRLLLSDSGLRIKALQSKVNEELKKIYEEEGGGAGNTSSSNVYLKFDTNSPNSNDSNNTDLLVKARQTDLAKAVELTEAGLKEILDLVTHLKVDPFIAPRIIGKGGEKIKKLTEGKSGYVEVDKHTGQVSVGATTIEERDAILKDVQDIVDNNQLIRLPVNKDLIKAQLRELGRSKNKAEINDLAWVGMDDDTGDAILIRGTKENIAKAKELMEEFLEANYLDEISMTDEDIEALLTGGKGSKIMKISEETGVNLSADKPGHAVILRGPSDKVAKAKKQLDQFVNGGVDGYSVARLTISEQVVGVVVGKGGKTRKELETKHGGVSINISKSHRVTIRGQQDGVAACRVEILKRVASARVTQTLDVSTEQEEILRKKDAVKRIQIQVPTHITVAEGKVTIKGSFFEVRDAVSLLNEQLTGEYKSLIELDAAQFSKVRATTKDPSLLERMEGATNAKIALDLASGSIAVSGKRSNVKKAKDQVFGFLSFILPDEIERLKISKVLQFSVGQAASLAEVSASIGGGAVIYLDRDLSSLIIRSSDKDMVFKAVEVLKEKVKEAEKLAYCLELPPQDAWLVALIIGRGGRRIAQMQKESGCKIDVSSESRVVSIVGDSEEKVAKARDNLDAYIEKTRKENVFVAMPESFIPLFIGKGGTRMKEFSEEHGAEIQRIKKAGYAFKITGDAEKVEATKEAIEEWIANKEKANANVSIPIEQQFISVVLGPKGETARALETEFGCRIDIDRKAMTCTIKGGDEEKREKTVSKIQEIVQNEKEAKAEAAAQRKEQQGELQSAKSDSSDDSQPPVVEKSKSNDSIPSIGDDSANSRSKEFPSQPVGVKKSAKKTSSGRNGNGKKNKQVDNSVQQGTEAGRNLFNLLVSD